MKLPCKVIEDMLPMYYDKVCSEESAALVEEHLKDCPRCGQMLLDLRSNFHLPEKKVDDTKPLRKIQKSYKKMRLRWLIAILVTLSLVPVAFAAGNDYSPQSEQGVEYSEQDALACSNNFMSCLVEGDYTKAYSYLDIDAKKHQWMNDWFKEEDLLNFEADGLKKFCELGEQIEGLGGIESYEYIESVNNYAYDYRGNQVYYISFNVNFEGEDEEFCVTVTENGISSIIAADGLIEHPLGRLGIWGHLLWMDYQNR